MSAFNLNAKQVDEATASIIARNFLSQKVSSGTLRAFSDLRIVHKTVTKDIQTSDIINESVLFYIYNADTSGYIIIAGDDAVNPVLAYSTESDFDPANIPPNMAKWLEGYKSQIREVIEKKYAASEATREQWESLLNNTPVRLSGRSVNPLIATKWNQSPYYNAMCPGGSVTGCVATAMAQIMKYWNYPERGSGFHSYDHPVYGTLSMNFAESEYQWSQMPVAVNSQNNAVAKLMYDVGVSVDMDYSPSSSGAQILIAQANGAGCSEYALKNFFGYKNSLHGIMKDDYPENEYVNILKDELDAGRPVLYGGIGTEGGHCFVADGYDSNGWFHFNWGWAGTSDGYFQINALNPGSLGTGGGSGGFNSMQQAVIGIEPSTPGGSQNFDLALYNNLSVSPSTVNYGGTINVITNVANYGYGTFNGELGVALFDENGYFVKFVEVFTDMTLQEGYTFSEDLQFTCSNTFNVLPGTYQVAIYSRTAGNEWMTIDDNGNYVNYAELTVVNENDIELSSAITAPANGLIQGKAATVSVNVANNGNTTFIGDYQVGLFNLDGTWAQTIEILTESEGLPPQYTYTGPLDFSTSEIIVEPGTYLLAVRHKANNGQYELSGSTEFQNPVKITVKETPLVADIYESNNMVEQAYALSPNFIDNTAIINTNGSNLHNQQDVDFYKINFQTGFNYAITVRLVDGYNNGEYSLDGLFAYSLNGIDWSEPYDDIMPNVITINNGGTLYLIVAPYFAGETGSYMSVTNIIRSSSVGLNESNPYNILVYPNPASELITIDARNTSTKLTEVTLSTLEGKVIQSLTNLANNLLTMPLNGLSRGIYLLKMRSNEGIEVRKVEVM